MVATFIRITIVTVTTLNDARKNYQPLPSEIIHIQA